MDNNETLRPCPFCGSSAGISKEYYDSIGPYKVSCLDEKSYSYLSNPPKCGVTFVAGQKTREKAIQQWNTRVQSEESDK